MANELGYEDESLVPREVELEYVQAKLMEIKKFANHHLWSDVHAYEVIRAISDKTVEVRRMKVTRDESVKLEFIPGGFAGHCPNQRQQKWIYESDESFPIERIRFSKAKNRWQMHGNHFIMSDKPYEFYDYNF